MSKPPRKTFPGALHRRIAAALARIQVITASAGRRAADTAGLSSLQMQILQRLTGRPGLRVGELARELKVTAGTLSAALTTLEEKGHVLKGADPNEHRAVTLRQSAKGARLAATLEDWADESLEPVVSDLAEDEAGQVLSSLLTVIRAAEQRGQIDATRMCLHCQYFQAWKGDKRGSKPHRCDLLQESIAASDLQVDCPDFERADPEALSLRSGVISPSAS